MRNKLPKEQMQKHTHHAHTTEELTIQQICAEMAQTWLTHLAGTKLEIALIQKTRVINQERLLKMLRRFSSKLFWTEKFTNLLVIYITCTQIFYIRPTKYISPHLWNIM